MKEEYVLPARFERAQVPVMSRVLYRAELQQRKKNCGGRNRTRTCEALARG